MATAPKQAREDGKVKVFTRFITVKGKRIYKKDGGMFVFWGDPDYKDQKAANDS